MPHTTEIQIRDPFVLPHHGEYLLFGSTDADIWAGSGTGFDLYRGTDLQHWTGPHPAFRPPSSFWSAGQYWAPEVHEYAGRFYMFATFGPGGAVTRRGTAILAADVAEGPFLPHSVDAAGDPAPVTPPQWDCLDGTLHIDHDGAAWMVFCHEWVQTGDGTICAVRLSEDLRRAAGEPVTLFAASEAPWTERLDAGRRGRVWVTDGPFLHRARDGSLLLLWASFRAGRYAQGLAVSASGRITGPWRHEPEPLYAADGGHGMLFRTLEGGLMLALHTPNRTPRERAWFLPVDEEEGSLGVRPGGGPPGLQSP